MSNAVSDLRFMRLALRLACRARGQTSPNPMVGAVLVRAGRVIGQGWHHKAGERHAEIEALRDAGTRGEKIQGATLYVTLEPCCTQGRTPPCTEAILAARIRRVVIAATDPNPKHAGRGFLLLSKAGVKVSHGPLAEEAARLNEAFNHWIVHRTPFVTVKAAMTLDGKIATASGESKWITGEAAREEGMRLRGGSDAILVGVNTILADDPSLTFRRQKTEGRGQKEDRLRRIILDSQARTPLKSRVVCDEFSALTTVVIGNQAPAKRVAALAQRVRVIKAPQTRDGRLNLRWLLRRLSRDSITSLLVEGGGEVNGSFLSGGLAQRVVFFYAPKILGGKDAHRAVAGTGAKTWPETLHLRDVEWCRAGEDLLMTALV